ncbi:MAG: hypothetical protein MPJ24_09255, partial [Pirellulaceae bacterium]|nr:hypothetical protein [Pirellulaceae bacterium]
MTTTPLEEADLNLLDSLRAPTQDRSALLFPGAKNIPALIRENRAISAQWHSAPILGTTAGELATLARKELLALSQKYTSQYLTPPPFSEKLQTSPNQENLPLILSGHQPELFHLGVWFKNFLLSAVAQKEGGIGINLIIDNDQAKTPTLKTLLPTDPLSEAWLPFNTPSAAPYEETILDDDHFATFPTLAENHLAQESSNLLLKEFWAKVTELMDQIPSESPYARKLAYPLSMARHFLENQWGQKTLELPL